jgi:DNA-binding LacI/PurR family transcriptional regulator
MNDHIHGGYLVGRHLAALGHRCIGYLAAGGLSVLTSQRRLQGLRTALDEAGVPLDEASLEWGAAHTAEEGYRGVARLLERQPGLTAIAAYNDWVAMGALRALHEMGKRVPQDVSLVGYGDIAFSPYTQPPLTTVHTPMDEVGKHAVDLILQLLRDQPLATTRVLVRPTLMERQSTAPPCHETEERRETYAARSTREPAARPTARALHSHPLP